MGSSRPNRHSHPSNCRRGLDAVLVLAASTIVAAAGVATADDGVRSVASHIPAASAAGVAPVAVIDRAEIERSGRKNVYDLLRGLTNPNNLGLNRPTVVGTDNAVYLVNGRRVPDPASFYALESLPISAVERIEILADSAAALHGGEAIGGAINIVLRRDVEGVEVQASVEHPTDPGGESRHASALWGGALGDGHVVVGADVFHRGEVRSADRDFSRSAWTPGGSFIGTVGVTEDGNTVYVPTRGFNQNGDLVTYIEDAEGLSIARALGDCRGGSYTGVLGAPGGTAGTGCGYALADSQWQRSRFERQSVFAGLDQPLGAVADLYADARAARGEIEGRSAPVADKISLDLTQALWNDLSTDLRPNAPDFTVLPDSIDVGHTFAGHGTRDSRTDIEDYDLTVGVGGRFAGGTGYDSHLRYYREEIEVNTDGYVHKSGIEQAVENGDYDLLNPLSRDSAHLAAIRSTELRQRRDGGTETKTVRASLDGTALALPGGPLRWAVGAEVEDEQVWRRIAIRDHTGRSYTDTDALGVSAATDYDVERRRRATFMEVSLPLLSDWEVSLAGRRDGYDDVDSTLSRRLASRYRLSEGVSLRGSWNEGGTPPHPALLVLPQTSIPFRVCDTRNHAGSLSTCDRTVTLIAIGGNPSLEPSENDSVSYGVAAEAGPLSFSADRFRIRVVGEPGVMPPQVLVDREAAGQALPPGAAVIRSGGTIERVIAPLVNTGERRVSGIDLRAGAAWEADWAAMNLDLRWLRITRYEVWTAGELDPGDHSRDRVHAALRASRGDLTAQWSLHAVSGRRNAADTGRYRSWMGHDATVTWRDAFGIGGMDLSGGILNVANRGPSIDTADPSAASGGLDAVLGRTIFISATIPLG